MFLIFKLLLEFYIHLNAMFTILNLSGDGFYFRSGGWILIGTSRFEGVAQNTGGERAIYP